MFSARSALLLDSKLQKSIAVRKRKSLFWQTHSKEGRLWAAVCVCVCVTAACSFVLFDQREREGKGDTNSSGTTNSLERWMLPLPINMHSISLPSFSLHCTAAPSSLPFNSHCWFDLCSHCRPSHCPRSLLLPLQWTELSAEKFSSVGPSVANWQLHCINYSPLAASAPIPSPFPFHFHPHVRRRPRLPVCSSNQPAQSIVWSSVF